MDFDEWSIRLAREFYRRSERDAQAESSFKTARKLANGMGDELAPTLAAASAALGKEVQSFKRGGLALEGLGFNTTSAFLQARLRFAIPERKQSDRILPLPADIDLGMRIHESAANEAAETEFAGRSFRLDGVSKVYDDLTRGLIRDGRKDSVQKAGLKKIEKALADLAGNPVNITFAKKDPVTVAFADQGFSVEFRIAAVQQEKTAYAGLRVMAAYRFENVASGVQAARIGPIQFFAEKAQPEKKLEALPAQYLFLLETLAAEVATERLILNPLPLPEALARLRLEPPRALAGDGWFALTWKLPARGKE
jgi:hypothetical protein